MQNNNRNLFGKIEEYRGTLQDLRVSMAQVSAQITALQDALAQTEKEILISVTAMEENQADSDETAAKLATTEKRITELHDRHNAIIEEEKQLRKKS